MSQFSEGRIGRVQELETELKKVTAERDSLYNDYQFGREDAETNYSNGGSDGLDAAHKFVMYLSNDTKQWAQHMATNFMPDIGQLSMEMKAGYLIALSNVFCYENGIIPKELEHGSSAERTPALILSALLAHDICTQIFSSPFFFLPKDGKGSGEVDALYQEMLIGDEEGAHLWRARGLRILCLGRKVRPGHKFSDEQIDLKSRLLQQLESCAQRYTSDFLCGPASHLIDQEKRFSEQSDPRGANTQPLNHDLDLLNMYRSSVNTAYELWTTRNAFNCITLKDLGEKTFDVEDPSMVANRLVALQEHDDKLKGRKINLVVFPGIEIRGEQRPHGVYVYDDTLDKIAVEVWLPSRYLD